LNNQQLTGIGVMQLSREDQQTDPSCKQLTSQFL
jgi:hypothetical protein